MTATVLVVEDEYKLRTLVRTFLEREGLSVLSTGSGAEAVSLGMRSRPDLVVLDLGLPDLSGLDVAAELRREFDPLVLILTSLAGEDDRIRGLELGADDYVTKPFSPRELALRVLALLRRGRTSSEAQVTSFGGGAVVIDEERHELYHHGTLVRLSPTEWGIVHALARAPGRVYSRYELVNAVRGHEWEGYERVVDSHVKNVRRKLKEDDTAAGPRVIETVLGVGYRLGLARDR